MATITQAKRLRSSLKHSKPTASEQMDSEIRRHRRPEKDAGRVASKSVLVGGRSDIPQYVLSSARRLT
jgi:hypothetical protein